MRILSFPSCASSRLSDARSCVNDVAGASYMAAAIWHTVGRGHTLACLDATRERSSSTLTRPNRYVYSIYIIAAVTYGSK